MVIAESQSKMDAHAMVFPRAVSITEPDPVFGKKKTYHKSDGVCLSRHEQIFMQLDV